MSAMTKFPLTVEEAAACARIRAACRLAPDQSLVDAAHVVEVLAGGGSFHKDGRLHSLHEGVLEAAKRNGDLAREHAEQVHAMQVEHDRVVMALRSEVSRLAALLAQVGVMP